MEVLETRNVKPTIWVDSVELEEAVRAGGGNPTADIDEATAVVWAGNSLTELAGLLRPTVRWLQLPSAGVERYLAAGLIDPSRTNTCAGPAYARTVAEHALALMLACRRLLPGFSRAREWDPREIRTLVGTTVAIVGCGRIGRALIELLGPFGVRILASTRSGRPVDGAATTVDASGVDGILAEADLVVIAAPATADTVGLIDRDRLDVMRDDAYLVNIARGSLVDTDALVEAIRSGTIAGAALDVTDPEPLPKGHPLWKMDGVLITPHIANPDAWDKRELSKFIKENVRRFASGEPLLGAIDLDRGY